MACYFVGNSVLNADSHSVITYTHTFNTTPNGNDPNSYSQFSSWIPDSTEHDDRARGSKNDIRFCQSAFFDDDCVARDEANNHETSD